MRSLVNRWRKKKDEGQGMVEYGLIIALVSIVAVIALTALGGKVTDKFEDVNAALDSSTIYTVTFAGFDNTETPPTAVSGRAGDTITLPAVTGLTTDGSTPATQWDVGAVGSTYTIVGNVTINAS